MPSPGGRGQGLEKWDILGAVLGSCLWPEGGLPLRRTWRREAEVTSGPFVTCCWETRVLGRLEEAGGDG